MTNPGFTHHWGLFWAHCLGPHCLHCGRPGAASRGGQTSPIQPQVKATLSEEV